MMCQKESGKNENITFICFGGEDWWYHNRAHTDMQLMRRFSKKGTTVYVNSIMMRRHKIIGGSRFTEKLVRKVRSILKGLKKSGAGFWVYSPFTLPMHHISWARPLNQVMLRYQIQRLMQRLDMNAPVVWVACPAACDTAINMEKAKLVYQRTDRYEDDPNVDRDAILDYDGKLKAAADITVYVNRLLYDQEAAQCKKALFLDHGVDYEMFAAAELDSEKPADIAGMKRPIVGYFGALDGHKIDISFLEAVAERLPEMSFVFIGKPSLDCSGLSARKNVCLLGQKPYEQIPHYGKCFDVAILPWKINKWTEAANPIKFKEYLALGKPVVSTPSFSELQRYLDVVYQANSPEEFAECIRKAYSQDSAELVKKRRQRVAETSWDSKAELLIGELFKEN
jgi:glycosyltransferase involved in cell wall biosynthesis